MPRAVREARDLAETKQVPGVHAEGRGRPLTFFVAKVGMDLFVGAQGLSWH